MMLDGGSNRVVVSDRLTRRMEIPMVDRWTRMCTVEGVTEAFRPNAPITILNETGEVELPISNALVSDFTMTQEDRPPRNEETLGEDYLRDVVFDELERDDVDVILPIGYCWTWLGGEVRRSTRDKPMAVKTPFGWTLAGGGCPDGGESCFRTTIEVDNEEIHGQIQRLFQTDFPPIKTNRIHPSIEDKHAMKQLRETVKFDEGLQHWRVGLPYKTSREEAAEKLNPINSSGHALNRLHKTIEKLRREPEKLKLVRAQMQTIFDDGHAVFLEDDDKAPEGCPSWVLPLHVVFHPDKPTKPRCCHDGASKLKGTCLNDNVLKGEDLLNSLFGIILRFRAERVTVSADIKGFFHQVYVDEQDKYVFQFWWYEDDEMKKPKRCLLQVHIFGAKSSPTVCTFVLQHHGEVMKGQISLEVAEAILRAFYVDDFLCSYADTETARRIRIELTEALRKGGFELTKWMS